MAAEFTDNLSEFLADKLLEFNPSLSVGEGTAIRDLFIKPFTVIFQPIVDEILSVRANLSLEGAADLEDEDLDRLAANFFITRKPGSQATGVVRLFFNEPVDDFVAQSTIFLAATGVRFLATTDTTITSSGLRLNTFGDLFFQDISVQAEEAGTSGNIPADLITEVLAGSDKIVDVTNPAAFTGGTDAETNEELVARLQIAITFRNLINKPGAKLILLENFQRLIDVLVVGFADQYTIEGEVLGTGNGVTTFYQLSETEDVITTSLDAFLDVQDELVLTGPVAAGVYNLDFFPYTFSTLELRHGASFATGTPLAPATDFTVASESSGTFNLTVAGAAAIGGNQLHARYKAGPLAASLVSVNFNGAVTFTVPPAVGTVITADFSYYLMRRDRMSGTGITLGDDTFGTVTNVHIGGKVDYYLRFSGLEEKEVRINGLKSENFLFEQQTTDPAPTGTQQYISGFTLPLVTIKNIEKIDPGTNLPSGVFLATPADYSLTILPNKLNVNMSTRQRVKLDIAAGPFIGSDVFVRYFTHQDFAAVQAFIDDEVNRIVTADLLARAPMPCFVDITINYSRLSGGPSQDEVKQVVTDFINTRKLGECISIFELTTTLSGAGVQFVQLPITMSATRVNLDFSTVSVNSTNKIEMPPNFQLIARTVTVNEIELDKCDEI